MINGWEEEIFGEIDFENDPSRNNQITYYGCKTRTFEIKMSNEQRRQEKQ